MTWLLAMRTALLLTRFTLWSTSCRAEVSQKEVKIILHQLLLGQPLLDEPDRRGDRRAHV